ncbi:MAG: substrate-binding periplasmic protein [Alphaproteobacteria bacterium]
MIKKIFPLLLLGLLASCLKTIDFPKTFFTKKDYCSNIKIVANPNYQPFSILNNNNEYVGFGIDAANVIFDNLNISHQILLTKTWEESVNLITSGKADLIIGIYYDQKANFINYIEPPFVNDDLITLYNQKKLSELDDFQSLNSGRNLYFALSSKYNCPNMKEKIAAKLVKIKTNNQLNEMIANSIKNDNISSSKITEIEAKPINNDENRKNAVSKPINILNF